jgi:hypothetical protein
MTAVNDTETRGKVLKALGNPKYKWRTLTGIAEEAHVDREIVLKILEESEDVVRSAVPGPHGEALFTTRSNYLSHASLFERFRSYVTNRLE